MILMCEYCEIIKREKTARIIFEDNNALAFIPEQASVVGEVILIPKTHYQIIEQVPDEIISHLFVLSRKLSDICFEILSGKGTNILILNGIPAGQEVAHFSIKILPRKEGDNPDFKWAGDTKQAQPEELQSAMDILLGEAKHIHINEKIEHEIIHKETPKSIETKQGEIDYRLDFFRKQP